MTKTLQELRMVPYLARRLLPLAAGIGLLLALLVPATYWIIEHRNLQRIASVYAGNLAHEFERFALDTPNLWKYQSYKFDSLIDRFHPATEVLGFSVLDEKGKQISGYTYKDGGKEHGQSLTFVEDLTATLGSAAITFNNRRVGSIEVYISDAHLLQTCTLLLSILAIVGAALAWLVYAFPIRVAKKLEGEIEGLIATVQESEEKYRQLNEELEVKVKEKTRQLLDAQEELVRKEKLAVLGQIAGSVGHELRNPLGVMSNAIFYLRMVHADDDDTTREYLDMIKYEIDNSQRIITDLLDFARTRTPQTQVVSARTLIDESLRKCVLTGNVAVQTELPESLPPLKVDLLQMGQVLQNLMTNAVQAMPGGGTLRVAARQSSQAKGDDHIAISITDSGEGITQENMKKLFQPLFTTKSKGIGLGLVVCKNLVEANGGRIDVASSPGAGTTFTVTLPIEREGL